MGRGLEEWLYRPKLVIDFIPGQTGFCTEGTWKEGDTELTEMYIRARVRNLRGGIAKQCRPFLTKLEEVHPAGTTQTPYSDSLVLPWSLRDCNPQDIRNGIDQFFDVVGVLKNRSGWRFTFREHFTGYAALPDYRGTYRFTLLVTGDGVSPAGRKIDVTYNGGWHNLRAVDAGRLEAIR